MAISETPNTISFEKTVTAAGTAEALGTGRVASLVIRAKSSNTGQVYWGGSDVASTTNGGIDPGDSMPIVPAKKYIDLAGVFIDVDTNGEGVDFWAVKS